MERKQCKRFYLFSIVVLSLFLNPGPVFAAAALSAATWDFLFLPPKYAFVVGELRIRYPMSDPRIFKVPSYTGSAIVGAVRADYFAGAGLEAGELAGQLKQTLRLWVLWPR